MDYNKYNCWRKAVSNDTTNYKESDMRAKVYLSQLAKDDVARKMLGLKLLNDGIIGKDLMDIMMLKQLGRYF